MEEKRVYLDLSNSIEQIHGSINDMEQHHEKDPSIARDRRSCTDVNIERNLPDRLALKLRILTQLEKADCFEDFDEAFTNEYADDIEFRLFTKNVSYKQTRFAKR